MGEDNMMDRLKLEESWKTVLQDEFQKDYMLNLREFLVHEKRAGKVASESTNVAL